MEISAGLLLSSADLVRMVEPGNIPAELLKAQFGKLTYSDIESVLSLSQRCGWVRLDSQGKLLPGLAGLRLLCAKSDEEALRSQLQDVVSVLAPAWAQLIPKGRNEARLLFPPDVAACFEAANLFDSHSVEVVLWWDSLIIAARGQLNAARLELGRSAERLSVEYEHKRTGKAPRWESLESEFSGFDIASIVGPKNSRKLLIEVKASGRRLGGASFFVTSHEAEVAATAADYMFHLWLFAEKRELFVIPYRDVEKHLPGNRGSGEWQQVRVPYKQFLKNRKPATVLPR